MKIDLIPYSTDCDENNYDGYIFDTEKKYDIIYADPPWSFNDRNVGGNNKSGSVNKYNCMTLDQIKSLPVADICKSDCFLFMWWVASMPLEAIIVLNAWGFELKTMTAFSWIKKTKHWKDHFGMGRYTRQQQEHCLVATTGKPKIISNSVRQNIREENVKHSKKPRTVLRKIEELTGKTGIELFAREKTSNWDCFGDEI